MGCLCKSLLCVAYSPPATKSTPYTADAGSDISTPFLLMWFRSERGKSDFKWPSSLWVYLFSGLNTCGPQQRKAWYVSLLFSVRLTVSWHSRCNRVGQDRSGPLSPRWPSPGQPSVPSLWPHLRDQSNGINWQQVYGAGDVFLSPPASWHAHVYKHACTNMVTLKITAYNVHLKCW